LFPAVDVSSSDVSNILSPISEQSIIHKMFRLKFENDGSNEDIEDQLKAYMVKIKQNYPDVLCALIHTKEYYTSLAQSFTDITFTYQGDMEGKEEDAGDFVAMTDQIQDEVVKAAMFFLKKKCDQLAQTVDTDIVEFIEIAKEYIRSECHKIISIQ
jgi:hypothetical protein